LILWDEKDAIAMKSDGIFFGVKEVVPLQEV